MVCGGHQLSRRSFSLARDTHKCGLSLLCDRITRVGCWHQVWAAPFDSPGSPNRPHKYRQLCMLVVDGREQTTTKLYFQFHCRYLFHISTPATYMSCWIGVEISNLVYRFIVPIHISWLKLLQIPTNNTLCSLLHNRPLGIVAFISKVHRLSRSGVSFMLGDWAFSLDRAVVWEIRLWSVTFSRCGLQWNPDKFG